MISTRSYFAFQLFSCQDTDTKCLFVISATGILRSLSTLAVEAVDALAGQAICSGSIPTRGGINLPDNMVLGFTWHHKNGYQRISELSGNSLESKGNEER